MPMVKLEPKSKSRPGVHYYVQPTVRDGKRLVTGAGQEAADEEHAKRIAYRMFERAVGVVAFEIDVDMDGELISEPRIILTIGTVPGMTSVNESSSD